MNNKNNKLKYTADKKHKTNWRGSLCK